ncbi:Creatinine amidohydrolase [Sulfitobacter sp. THAF37]|uniref:creatininase family protein n=1 Tax=Sulfitobacter sp. THAF37 TaxID=2587855 RepID=UPI0012AA13C7|nr:creatininase family protein [Sulfitobacter sp. THAF37]QFT57196.1 Creatinine amidohydrolase [Sulfitobacter sp. THAF37]
MTEVEWQRLKAHEIRRLAEQDAVVILPVASIEQHGPHLPTMTDTRLGHEFAVRAARLASQTRPVVVAPVLWSGLSEHHMTFGGTLTIGPDTFRALVSDLVTALTRQGFRHILIANSHGGNTIALQQICNELAATSPATLVMTSYASEAAAEIKEILEDQDGLQHACEAETSMMMACEGALVDDSDLAGLANTKGRTFLRAGKGSYRWRPFTHLTGNGVAGDPTRSSADKGTRLLEAGAASLAALITDPQTWEDPEDLRSGDVGGVAFRD